MDRWLCTLGRELSAIAYNDLSVSHDSGGRLQLSETGITHVLARLMWLSAINSHRASRFIVIESSQADERKSGADLEIWFTDGTAGLAWRIQAKRLYPAGPVRAPRYERMDHKVSGRLQATLLLQSAARDQLRGLSVAPLYWLYSFDPTGVPHTSSVDCRCGASDSDDGILVAPATRVRSVVVRRKRMVEPFSYHRWRQTAPSLGEILCPRASHPSTTSLDWVSSVTAAIDPAHRPPGEMPQFVYDALEQPDGGLNNTNDDLLDGSDSAPNAAVTAIIEMSED